mmetsp:Transcript_6221/g.7072  ORF Transcript_6221/g.7072 Transcript_6221/m.7072 type:complete len:81 (+) Transcript_6221:169-411(+)
MNSARLETRSGSKNRMQAETVATVTERRSSELVQYNIFGMDQQASKIQAHPQQCICPQTDSFELLPFKHICKKSCITLLP